MLKSNKNGCKLYKIILSVFIMCIFIANTTSYALASRVQEKNLCDKVDEYMNALVNQKKFSGSILVAQKGKILISKGYGMSNYELNVPNSSKTVFRIGSITKQFTALAVMQLEEQGKIKTSDTINKYIKDYPQGDKITIHQLLTHSSGVFDYTHIPDFQIKCREHKTPEELISSFKNQPSDFKPGVKYSYDNSGYIILGYIIEKVSGKPYEEYIKKNILDKAQMSNSYFDNKNEIIPNRANGYGLGNSGLINCGFIDMSFPYAAGELYSTVEDLYKWDKSLLNNKLISKKTWGKMIAPYESLKGLGIDGDYGYGLMSAEMPVGSLKKKVIFHNGGINGFISNNCMFVDDDIQVTILTNLEYTDMSRVSMDVAKMIFNQEYDIPKEPKIINVDSKVYENYVGKYAIDKANSYANFFTENNSIFVDLGAKGKYEIFPSLEDKEKSIYVTKIAPLEFVFYKDSNGKILKVDINVDGERQVTANKVEK